MFQGLGSAHILVSSLVTLYCRNIVYIYNLDENALKHRKSRLIVVTKPF